MPTAPAATARPRAARAAPAPSRPRLRDAAKTRRDILDAATAEFAAHGLAGGRVDEIAARTRTTKRMIYYYFASKQALYAAVLEEQYGAMRDAEAALDLDALSPVEAMRRLVETTFDHHADHPDFCRLVAAENILLARNVKASPAIRARNAQVIGSLSRLTARGAAAGVFRGGVDPFDLHVLINGFCFHRVANRHTLGAIFGHDLAGAARRQAQRAMITAAVLRYLAP
jgi:AcrR family transcriptional regulator